MNWHRVMETFDQYRTNQPVMVSPGMAGSILYSIGHRDPAMYGVGLSYATPYCFGLALTRPDLKIVAIEGDGSLIAGLGNLTTIGRYRPKNLVILVMDNGSYVTTGDGSLPAATAYGINLAGIARDAGIEQSVAVDDLKVFEQCIQRALAEDGPWLIVCKIDEVDRGDKRRPYALDRVEQGIWFRRYLLEHPSTASA